jgi:hypothetical protein
MTTTLDSIPAVPAENKIPWKPKTAGYLALFLRPMGGVVSAVNFRRMGQARKGQHTLFCTLLLCIAFLIPFLLAIPAEAPMEGRPSRCEVS